MKTVYIVSYKIGLTEEVKLAQIEAEDINSAIEKVKGIFLELESAGKREHNLIDVVRLSEIRKLDALD